MLIICFPFQVIVHTCIMSSSEVFPSASLNWPQDLSKAATNSSVVFGGANAATVFGSGETRFSNTVVAQSDLGNCDHPVVSQGYNVSVRQFPKNILAGLFGFQPERLFAAAPGAETAPTVDFDEPAPTPTPASAPAVR